MNPNQTGEGNDFLRCQYEEWAEVLAEAPSLRLTRSLFEEWHRGTVEPVEVTYEERELGAIPGIWATPHGADPKQAILYTHGGGFTVGSAASHRKLAAHLAKALGANAFVADYRLAPENPAPAQLEDGVAAYEGMLAAGFAPEAITTAGDSAGGNLAVSIALEVRSKGLAGPGAVIAFSPWIDMEACGSTLLTNRQRDPLVTLEVVEGMAAGFLAEAAPDDPRLNPLHADLSGLPRLYVNAGGDEGLLADATRLCERAEAAGVDVTLSIAPGQLHVFPMAAGRGSIASEEIEAVAEWHRNRPSEASEE